MNAVVITKKESIVVNETYAFQRGGKVYYIGKFRGQDPDYMENYGYQFGDNPKHTGGNWSLTHLLCPVHTLMKIHGIEGIDFDKQKRDSGGCLIHNQDLADKLRNLI